jgi:hypothetical protein
MPDANDQIKNSAPNQAPQPPGVQIGIGGGLIPQANGSFIAHVWFSNLPNEAMARTFMGQLDLMIKGLFNQSPPPPPDDLGVMRQ